MDLISRHNVPEKRVTMMGLAATKPPTYKVLIPTIDLNVHTVCCPVNI
jgi:hypothetical protein